MTWEFYDRYMQFYIKHWKKRGKLEQRTSDKSEDIIYINNCLQREDEEKVKEICMFIKEYCAGDCSE